MFPPPTTIATSTPRSATRLTVRAMLWMRSASTPYESGPMRASPESFSRMRRNAGLPLPAERWPFSAPSGTGEIYSFTNGKAREAPDHHVLARLCGNLRPKLLDRASVVLVGIDVLLTEKHVLLEPLPETPLRDLLAHVRRLALVCLCLEDRELAV